MPENTEGGAGGGDVHARMSATGGAQEELDVIYTPDREVSATEPAGRTAGSRRAEMKERAQEFRGRASEAMEQAKDKLEDTGVMTRVREHPLPALGIAFAIGFVLAGSGARRRQRQGAFSMAQRQIRAAVMGGLSAALAREARSMMGMQGSSGGDGMFGSLFGGRQSEGQGGQAGGPPARGSASRSSSQQHYH